VQPVANLENDNAASGIIPLYKIENAVKKLVENRSMVIGNRLNGEWPVSIWFQKETELDNEQTHSQRCGPENAQIASGIVAYLMERLLWPDGYGKVANENVFLLLSGKLHRFDIEDSIELGDVLYQTDPVLPSGRGKTKHEAIIFSEFGANSRCDQPFLDRNSWTIREMPHFQLAACKDERDEMQKIWERLSAYHGGTVVYRRKSGRSNRYWYAASEVARSLEPILNAVLTNKIPQKGTPQFTELVKELVLYFWISPERKRLKPTAKRIAQCLGLNDDEKRNRSIRAIHKAVKQEMFEVEELRSNSDQN
jgi:hypothetical protein